MSPTHRNPVSESISLASTLLTLGVFSAILVACFWLLFVTRIPPGTVGVVVNLMGNEKGVEDKELTVGLHCIAPWKDVYQFPTFEQNHTWTVKNGYGFQFQTSEGLVVTASLGISFHLRPESIPILFQKYRRGMDEITDIFVRNTVRDAINRISSKLRIEDLYGSHKDSFLDDVQSLVSAQLEPLGIVISRIYLIGSLHFPDNVVAALNSKIEATQRAQQRENELREAEAQAAKDVASATGKAESLLVEARANAEANRLLLESLTTELIIYQAVQKWDGALPKYLGTASPMMDISR